MNKKRDSFVFFVGVWCAATFFFALPPTVAAQAIAEDSIIDLVNYERIQLRRSPLTPNALLDIAAENRASDMIKRDYFDHQSPTGEMPWDSINEAGYPYIFAGENLAIDYEKTEDVVEAWLESPTHRDNIINEKYQDIGISVKEHEGHTIIVLLFGARTAGQAAQGIADPGNDESLMCKNQSLSTISISDLPTSENLIHSPFNEKTGFVLGAQTTPIQPLLSYLIPASFVYLISSFLVFPFLTVQTVDIKKA